jgi:ketol-acid reductoisomerase
MRFDQDVDPAVARGQRVAVVGYGSQGHAHALNLRDSGVDVCVALRPNSPSRRRALDAGLRVVEIDEATRSCELISLLLPDTAQPDVFNRDILPHLQPGQAVVFAHGFNVHFRTLLPPPSIDVLLVAPKGPGHRLRESFLEGGGLPALIAVHQDATGSADARALAYAWGIGCARVGMLDTTFAEETETDLFGEQAVLCGGVVELVKASFATLVTAGYQPEVAYFECMHELKLVADLMYRGGLTYLRHAISDTAEWGGYVSGPRVVDGDTRQRLQAILADIQDGTFARSLVAETAAGSPNLRASRAEERTLPIESVGAQLRAMMPFVAPVEVPNQE